MKVRPTHAPLSERLARRTSEPDARGCRVWKGAKTRGGYGNIGDRGRFLRAHRAAWEIAHGPIPRGLMVRHLCDNPPCVEVSHLVLGTAADNSQDAIERGRTPRGSRHYLAKLSDADVLDVRRMLAFGASSRAIADRFGITTDHVRSIALGRRRQNVREGL